MCDDLAVADSIRPAAETRTCAGDERRLAPAFAKRAVRVGRRCSVLSR